MKQFIQTVPFIIILALLCSNVSGQPIHNDITKMKCLDCHRKLPLFGEANTFLEQSDRICYECHESGMSGFSHPLGVIPSMQLPADLPLSEGGTILCITCHTFHTSPPSANSKRKNYLRRQAQGVKFCLICHEESFPVSSR